MISHVTHLFLFVVLISVSTTFDYTVVEFIVPLLPFRCLHPYLLDHNPCITNVYLLICTRLLADVLIPIYLTV